MLHSMVRWICGRLCAYLHPTIFTNVCKKVSYKSCRVSSATAKSTLCPSPQHTAVVDTASAPQFDDMLGSRTPSTTAPGQSADHQRQEPARSERFLRKPEVLTRTGISRSHLYWLMDRGRFPRSIPLSPRVTVWLESDVDAWIAAHIPATHLRAQP